MSHLSRCKCMIIGDSAVGKTSIIKVLLGHPNQFPNKYLMTTGIDIFSKTIRIPNSEQSVQLFIYDCSGKHFYREIVRKVWSKNESLIVAVFDVTNEESFHSLQNWLTEIFKAIKSSESTIGVIIGNKIDLIDRRIVSSDDAHRLAKKYKMRYFDCSAKEFNGIEEPFVHLVTNWLEMHSNHINSSLNPQI